LFRDAAAAAVRAQRKENEKARARPGLAGLDDRAVVRLDDPLDDRQPSPMPRLRDVKNGRKIFSLSPSGMPGPASANSTQA
jgi:hypothetical protein